MPDGRDADRPRPRDVDVDAAYARPHLGSSRAGTWSHGDRHRGGMDGATRGTDLRAVLHDQGARPGHGPRPRDRLRHREAVAAGTSAWTSRTRPRIVVPGAACRRPRAGRGRGRRTTGTRGADWAATSGPPHRGRGGRPRPRRRRCSAASATTSTRHAPARRGLGLVEARDGAFDLAPDRTWSCPAWAARSWPARSAPGGPAIAVILMSGYAEEIVGREAPADEPRRSRQAVRAGRAHDARPARPGSAQRATLERLEPLDRRRRDGHRPVRPVVVQHLDPLGGRDEPPWPTVAPRR